MLNSSDGVERVKQTLITAPCSWDHIYARSAEMLPHKNGLPRVWSLTLITQDILHLSILLNDKLGVENQKILSEICLIKKAECEKKKKVNLSTFYNSLVCCLHSLVVSDVAVFHHKMAATNTLTMGVNHSFTPTNSKDQIYKCLVLNFLLVTPKYKSFSTKMYST